MGMPRTSASVATRLGLSRLVPGHHAQITHQTREEYQSSELNASRDSDESLKDIN